MSKTTTTTTTMPSIALPRDKILRMFVEQQSQLAVYYDAASSGGITLRTFLELKKKGKATDIVRARPVPSFKKWTESEREPPTISNTKIVKSVGGDLGLQRMGDANAYRIPMLVDFGLIPMQDYKDVLNEYAYEGQVKKFPAVWAQATEVPKYYPQHKFANVNVKTADKDKLESAGADLTSLTRAEQVRDLYVGSTIYDDLATATAYIFDVANKHYYGNGSISGQLHRYKAVLDVGLYADLNTKFAPDNEWFEYLNKEIRMAKPVVDYNLSIFEMLESGELLDSVRMNMEAGSGVVWGSLKREATAFQDIILADILLNSLEGSVFSDESKKWEWTKIVKMKPKAEVYLRKELKTKTRNYYEFDAFSNLPMQVLYDHGMSRLFTYEESNTINHLLKWSPYHGNMDRLVKDFLKSEVGWFKIFSDNVYVKCEVYDKNQYEKFKLLEEARKKLKPKICWASLDGSKMEACFTPAEIKNFCQWFASTMKLDGKWNTYATQYFPWLISEAYGLLNNVLFKIPGHASGNLLTGLLNTIKMFRLFYNLKVAGRKIVLLQSALDYSFEPVCRDIIQKTGIQLTVECVTPEEHFFGSLSRFTEDENTIAPREDMPLVKLDLLGYDACYIPEIDTFAPILDVQRLAKAFCFVKNPTDPSLPVQVGLANQLAKIRSLYLVGGWYYPGFDTILRHMESSVAEALTDVTLKGDLLADYAKTLDRAGVIYASQAIASLTQALADDGYISTYKCLALAVGEEKTEEYFIHLQDTYGESVLNLMNYAQYKKMFGEPRTKMSTYSPEQVWISANLKIESLKEKEVTRYEEVLDRLRGLVEQKSTVPLASGVKVYINEEVKKNEFIPIGSQHSLNIRNPHEGEQIDLYDKKFLPEAFQKRLDELLHKLVVMLTKTPVYLRLFEQETIKKEGNQGGDDADCVYYIAQKLAEMVPFIPARYLNPKMIEAMRKNKDILFVREKQGTPRPVNAKTLHDFKVFFSDRFAEIYKIVKLLQSKGMIKGAELKTNKSGKEFRDAFVQKVLKLGVEWQTSEMAAQLYLILLLSRFKYSADKGVSVKVGEETL